MISVGYGQDYIDALREVDRLCPGSAPIAPVIQQAIPRKLPSGWRYDPMFDQYHDMITGHVWNSEDLHAR